MFTRDIFVADVDVDVRVSLSRVNVCHLLSDVRSCNFTGLSTIVSP